MDLQRDPTLVEHLKSGAQRARVLSEAWTAKNLFCPNCPSGQLEQFPNNAEVADFECPRCKDQFEIKSGKRIGAKIANGAYHSLIKRLEASDKVVSQVVV